MDRSISLCVSQGQQLHKGQEIGSFKYGASSITLLLEPGSIDFDQDLLAYSLQGRELRVRYGQSLGRVRRPSPRAPNRALASCSTAAPSAAADSCAWPSIAAIW